ncbi:hypothetical protein MMC25_003797 [Agyrium rufum]|nr:hypothetical protein [Agyrium rufum]
MPSVLSNPSTPNGTKSGIITSADGERHIPASVRADGSTRREIKIRPGYKPPEDVEVYKNRTADAWKTRGKGGVPGAASLESEEKTNGASAASNKNAKRREARKKAAKASVDTVDGSTAETPSLEPASKSDTAQEQPSPVSTELEPEAEKEKQARNLKKKLRQARELREKKDKGENLLPEQFEKVIKIQELIRQLDSLGFDTGGNKKENDSPGS